jgi:hypothetical protein
VMATEPAASGDTRLTARAWKWGADMAGLLEINKV